MSGQWAIGFAVCLFAGAVILGATIVQMSSAPHPGDGATVARICRDGSHIWHWQDGTYRTSFGDRVDDIATVCQ